MCQNVMIEHKKKQRSKKKFGEIVLIPMHCAFLSVYFSVFLGSMVLMKLTPSEKHLKVSFLSRTKTPLEVNVCQYISTV